MLSKLIALVLFGAVLTLGAEVAYMGTVIENQRTTIMQYFEGCVGQQQ